MLGMSEGMVLGMSEGIELGTSEGMELGMSEGTMLGISDANGSNPPILADAWVSEPLRAIPMGNAMVSTRINKASGMTIIGLFVQVGAGIILSSLVV